MHVLAVCLGFAIDAAFGDPPGLWHPVCAIGKLIAYGERALRGLFSKTPRGKYAAGVMLWILVCALSCGVSAALLWLAWRLHPAAGFALETLMCGQIFARRSLCDESRKVYDCLAENDLPGARTAVSYIVGRDTAALDAAGVTRAAVETVAENASDGVVAPMLFLILGGAPLGFLYKAVNTMDSMIGYKNEKYLHFGRFAAKMDDLFNWLPARLTAFCMILSARFSGLDGKNAFRIWRRDRKNHASPNAAQGEAACAGALHVQLAGNAYYFGKLHEKPTIGDADRPVEPADIVRAGRFMTAASVLALIVLACAACLIRSILWN